MLTRKQALDRYFLDVRCALVEVAATLDRIDRGDDDAADDGRLTQLREAIALLQAPSDQPDRSERLLRHFSDLDGIAHWPHGESPSGT